MYIMYCMHACMYVYVHTVRMCMHMVKGTFALISSTYTSTHYCDFMEHLLVACFCIKDTDFRKQGETLIPLTPNYYLYISQL